MLENGLRTCSGISTFCDGHSQAFVGVKWARRRPVVCELQVKVQAVKMCEFHDALQLPSVLKPTKSLEGDSMTIQGNSGGMVDDGV
jgi:hypothetical protein